MMPKMSIVRIPSPFRTIPFLAVLALLAVASVLVPPGASATPASITWTRDVQYDSWKGSVPLRMDVATPSGASASPRPVVLIVHGGGWWSGNRKEAAGASAPIQQRLAAAGYVSVAIDYALGCGGGPLPMRRAFGRSFTSPSPLCGAYVSDQVPQIQRAVVYLRRNAATFGADPKRIALLGISAGGHLALLAAATARQDARVSAVVNWSGAPNLPWVLRQNPRRHGTIVSSMTNIVGCGYSLCTQKWKLADPSFRMLHTRNRFAVMTASSLLEGTVPPDAMRAFHVQMTKAGWRSTLRLVPDACHGLSCWVARYSQKGSHSLLSDTAVFLRANVGAGVPGGADPATSTETGTTTGTTNAAAPAVTPDAATAQ